jgi:hypothetical protein
MYRMIDTNLRGYKTLASQATLDSCSKTRLAQLRARTREYGILLPVVAKYAVNEKERQRALALEDDISRTLGPPTVKEKLLKVAARVLAARWKLRLRILGDTIQPATIVTRFKAKGLLSKKNPVPTIDLGSSACGELPRRTPLEPAVQRKVADPVDEDSLDLSP